jgi:hypothetical protein
MVHYLTGCRPIGPFLLTLTLAGLFCFGTVGQARASGRWTGDIIVVPTFDDERQIVVRAFGRGHELSAISRSVSLTEPVNVIDVANDSKDQRPTSNRVNIYRVSKIAWRVEGRGGNQEHLQRNGISAILRDQRKLLVPRKNISFHVKGQDSCGRSAPIFYLDSQQRDTRVIESESGSVIRRDVRHADVSTFGNSEMFTRAPSNAGQRDSKDGHNDRGDRRNCVAVSVGSEALAIEEGVVLDDRFRSELTGVLLIGLGVVVAAVSFAVLVGG